MTLDEVALATKISVRNLASIEADDIAALPGIFFYRSFVSQYAGRLGMRDEAIEAELERLMADEKRAPITLNSTPSNEWKLPPMPSARRGGDRRRLSLPLALFFVAMAGCSALYQWWRQARDAKAAVAPTEFRAPAPPRPAPPATFAANRDVPVPPRAQPVSLNLAASETTWLSVSADGERVFSGVLRPNQSRAVAGRERARVVVGNAGGLTVQWNGKSIGSLGQRGEVRAVVFTPRDYQFVTKPRDSTR